MKEEIQVQSEKIEYEIDTKREFGESTSDQVAVHDHKPLGEEFIEEWHFTWRSCITGSLLGCLIAASNTYLGLKIGWTFGASMFGAIFSFAILKPLSRILPPSFGGGYFGPKENVTAQSAATTSGGLSTGFVSAIPAMYKLGLLQTPKADAAALTLFTISAAFYGLFFAVPLRRHFVVTQDLPFPTPRATAVTILALHNSVDGEKGAMKKAKWMGIWFVLVFIWTLIQYWVPFFEAIHILFWIGHSTGYTNMVSADLNWAWYFVWDWPFIGAGLMTPGSTVLSFFIATLFLYGVIGPVQATKGEWTGLGGFRAGSISAQSFFLWPGIALMVLSSIFELLVRYDTLWRGIKGGCIELWRGIRRLYYLFNVKVLRRGMDAPDPALESVPDEVYAEHELVPAYWWISGTFISIIFTCAVMGVYFHMPVGQSILAVILAFLFTFVGIQAAGETDINPIGAIGKMSQLIFSGIKVTPISQMQMNNLSAGNIAGSAAGQSVDMVGDLKTGQIVGASPRSQFLAQLVASIPAIGIAVGMFILFAEAYPCVTSTDLNMKCEFQLVAATAWLNVAKLLTGAAEPITRGSIILTGVCIAIGVISPFIKNFLVPERYRKFYPSLSAIGIAMINPSPEVPLAMFIGWTAGKIWKRVNLTSYDDFMYSVAGGMIAGQGIAALLKCVFQIAGVEGEAFTGSCPFDEEGHYCP
ncbi:OPT oligopeptide transporter protein-domain-containing protein [Dichotomocladium elegans]|nr:OPT oligopeptide transporter protein-domain-containing protein [Dichotomocladium elegans]